MAGLVHGLLGDIGRLVLPHLFIIQRQRHHHPLPLRVVHVPHLHILSLVYMVVILKIAILMHQHMSLLPHLQVLPQFALILLYHAVIHRPRLRVNLLLDGLVAASRPGCLVRITEERLAHLSYGYLLLSLHLLDWTLVLELARLQAHDRRFQWPQDVINGL